MRAETRARRQREIEQAAYAVLAQRGYAGTSMLAIARAARASNETLYNWYGDKQGLFRSLVARNAEEVRRLLESRISGQDDPLETLRLLGPKLLELLTGPGPVALNRAAAADPSNELGAAIGQAGRESITPLIAEVMEAARKRGQIAFRDVADAVGLYLDLLVGDLQIRCVIGRQAPPSAVVRRQRAALASTRLGILLSPEGKTAAG
ncbi:MAG: TetR/AcrR family transcriptional regulator [Gemmatimonadales bacterium]|nr:TetR/AcrR family transcriptional regulator [Gemmatimonadales bacterium]